MDADEVDGGPNFELDLPSPLDIIEAVNLAVNEPLGGMEMGFH